MGFGFDFVVLFWVVSVVTLDHDVVTCHRSYLVKISIPFSVFIGRLTVHGDALLGMDQCACLLSH